MKRIFILPFFLLMLFEVFSQDLTLCEHIETIEEVDAVYRLELDLVGHLYHKGVKVEDDLRQYVLGIMHSQFA